MTDDQVRHRKHILAGHDGFEHRRRKWWAPCRPSASTRPKTFRWPATVGIAGEPDQKPFRIAVTRRNGFPPALRPERLHV
jgi:hypothetical protein